MSRTQPKPVDGKTNEITISVKDFSDRLRRLLREEVQLAADRKELELQGKASGINVASIKKWLKAEVQDEEAKRPTRIAKLIEQTKDQVIYGESLGHDLGMLQNNEKSEKVIVRNNSKEPSALTTPAVAWGGGTELPPVSSPVIQSDVEYLGPIPADLRRSV